ncbi:MAG: hypothetical protein ISS15_12475 [Alphaproteobacteria bacterium]|nr:hypothetical protein [Alphaproteobacteria bacterium]MBL6936484.1 hypothetical protein [Alphaproteobacteria bacterium]MBL7098465.1 hypothetical protein [Alphaproteobacteria bacterium]
MMIVGLFAAAATTPAFAEAPDDSVPGHPGVTYAMLLKQIAPSLTRDQDVWTLSRIKNFRGMAPSKDPLSESISFSALTVQHVREDGHKRILLFSGDSAGDEGFDTLLAAYDDEAKTPKLLDYMNVGGDRFNDLREVKPIAPATDMFIVASTHSNSNQSYELDTPMFLRGGKLQTIDTFFIFGNSFCTYSEMQSPTYTTQPGKPYYDLKISVAVDMTRNTDECDNDSPKPPKLGSRTVSDTYRWNGKTFAPTTKAVARLSEADWKWNETP